MLPPFTALVVIPTRMIPVIPKTLCIPVIVIRRQTVLDLQGLAVF
jgi:hypothetical protein